MIVVIHRGYLGFQPERVTAEISYSFTEPKLESFISNGILILPVSGDDLNSNDLGNTNSISLPYKASRSLYFRYLCCTSKELTDNVFRKTSSDKEGSNPTFRSIVLDTTHSKSAVLAQDPYDGDYLAALVHADATLDQIDAFCQEYILGSAKPFVWTRIEDVYKLVKASIGKEKVFPFLELREGPSKHLIDSEVNTICDLVEKGNNND